MQSAHMPGAAFTAGPQQPQVGRSSHRRRAVLIECYRAHGECLDFQIKACQRAGMMVEVWTTKKNRWRPEAHQKITHVLLDGPVCFHAAWRLWRSPPALVAFNTATGPVVRDLLTLIRPLGLATLGIFHDVAKVRSHRSTRLIARMLGARIMLAQHLSFAAEREIGLPFDHVHLLAGCGRAQPDAHEVRIAIPGSFGFGKKDAEALLALACDARLDPRVRFVVLGRFSRDADVASWWQRCVAQGADQRIRRFTDFVPQAEFDCQLQRSSAVLPLIHPGCDHYARFHGEKISGAVNVALAAHLPLVIPADLARQWRFGPIVSSYTTHDDLLAVINGLADRPVLEAHKARIAGSNEAHPAFQQALYLRACARAVRASRGGPLPLVIGAHSAWKPLTSPGLPMSTSSPHVVPRMPATMGARTLVSG